MEFNKESDWKKYDNDTKFNINVEKTIADNILGLVYVGKWEITEGLLITDEEFENEILKELRVKNKDKYYDGGSFDFHTWR